MRRALPGVRARTLAIGAVLGGALLLAMALLGGAGDAPTPFEERAPDRRGPASAIQPELQRALLTGEDLAPVPVPSQPQAGPADPVVIAPAPSASAGPPAGRPETGALTELCRFLFDDAAELVGLWPTEPQEATARHTTQPDGGKLDQVLAVFDADGSTEAYRRLRESTAACETGGTPLAVLLRELESEESADDSHVFQLRLEDGTPAGWVSVDRIGPVVSVLRHLGPGADQDTIARIRHTALHKLHKLQALLRTLRG